MKISIVIPCRKESRLHDTVRQIDETCGPVKPEIIIVYDGEDIPFLRPRYSGELRQFSTGTYTLGTSASRHYGVMQASGEFVITIDGHMAFARNNWMDTLSNEIREFPRAVLCSRCVWLSSNFGSIREAKNYGTGAATHWKDPHGNSEYHVLQAKWHKQDPGEIGVVMGACYAFMRSWYVDGMQFPWRGAAGWGLDESVLSISSWLCGGSSRLVDTDVGHWFGEVQRRVPMGYGPKQLDDVWANRIRMLEILPLAADARNELMTYLKMSDGYLSRKNRIDARVRAGMEIGRVRNHLSAQKRTMDDYISEWVIK